MILPKLTVVGIPSDMPGENIISAICGKDEQINELVTSGKTLELIKCWDGKNNAGVMQSKKAAIKCSPEIRSYILNRNGGYIYLGLSRCEVYDRFYVARCYNCCGFNHFANDYPHKNKPICVKCAG